MALQNVFGDLALDASIKQPLLTVTNTAASGAACTLTIPAPGVNLFNYLVAVEIDMYAAAALTGGATPVEVTSTNIPGAPKWIFPTAAAIGTIEREIISLSKPVKSTTSNTATTIVGPATTDVIWRITAYYFTGA